MPTINALPVGPPGSNLIMQSHTKREPRLLASLTDERGVHYSLTASFEKRGITSNKWWYTLHRKDQEQVKDLRVLDPVAVNDFLRLVIAITRTTSAKSDQRALNELSALVATQISKAVLRQRIADLTQASIDLVSGNFTAKKDFNLLKAWLTRELQVMALPINQHTALTRSIFFGLKSQYLSDDKAMPPDMQDLLKATSLALG